MMKDDTTRKQCFRHFLTFLFFYMAKRVRVPVPGESDTYGGEYKFVTAINLELSIVYFAVSFFVDVHTLWPRNVQLLKTVQLLLSKDNQIHAEAVISEYSLKLARLMARIRDARDYFFVGVLFPTSTAVSLVYWGLYAMNPDYVSPPHIRAHVAVHGFYNHVTHSAPIVCVFTESVLTSHKLSKNTAQGAWGGLAFTSAYVLWLFWVKFWADIWVYPVLRILPPLASILLIKTMCLFGASLYPLHLKLKELAWGVCPGEKTK